MNTLKDALEKAFKDRKDQVITITISPPSKSVETEVEDKENESKESSKVMEKKKKTDLKSLMEDAD